MKIAVEATEVAGTVAEVAEVAVAEVAAEVVAEVAVEAAVVA